MFEENEFLLKCSICGTPFFSSGEKKFYESKGFTIPTKCKRCRDRIMQERNACSMIYPKKLLDDSIKQMYDEIIDNWSIEAKKENSAYFYNVKEISILLEGKRSFVIGRKGSGKTSIAQHLCGIN